MSSSFFLQKDNIYAVPITHYNMEMAFEVVKAFQAVKPTCVAVELAETMQLKLLHAAARLPDISIVTAYNQQKEPLYYLVEPCDGAFEGLRLALENHLPAFCIDLDVDHYPDIKEFLPDPYALKRLGLETYYSLYLQTPRKQTELDEKREFYMARRLKELALQYDKVLFVGGMYHVQSVLDKVSLNAFPTLKHADRELVEIATLTEASCRDVMAECGWFTRHYEENRLQECPDRQKLIYQLYKEASFHYFDTTGNIFPSYGLPNIMKFVRNYALTSGRLLPNLFQILTAAKGCMDSNYAYETWMLATDYPHLKNVDNLNELPLSIEEIWGGSKWIRFQLKLQNPKSLQFHKRKKDQTHARFIPPGPFSICSYPPEDVAVENFGDFLKKKGTQILTEDAARTIPFLNSLEDGIDTKETLRHWVEKKLYVKTRGKPPGGVGSIVVIFDEDQPDEGIQEEKFPWKTTWLGEHTQESDMAFYATPMTANIVGPGISRCQYGGFMMSYPPRRLLDVWTDPDYVDLRTKAEILLVAAIDYAAQPVVVYVASKPPRSQVKSYAKRFGKKVVYIPIGQLSPITLNKLRVFHVLDSHQKRDIAGEYIF